MKVYCEICRTEPVKNEQLIESRLLLDLGHYTANGKKLFKRAGERITSDKFCGERLERFEFIRQENAS